MKITSVLVPLLQMATAVPAVPQYQRAGRHGIELGIGLLDHTSGQVTVTTTGNTTTTTGTGVGGSLTYTYWLADDVGLSAQIGVVDVDASVSVAGTQSDVRSATVVPLLLGVKYQPFHFRGTERLRPYLSAAVGPYIGTAASVSAGPGIAGVTSRTEAAPGGRAGIGLDLLVSHRVMLGLGAGYRLMTDFDQAIGAERNYSGAELTLSAGLLLGRGR